MEHVASMVDAEAEMVEAKYQDVQTFLGIKDTTHPIEAVRNTNKTIADDDDNLEREKRSFLGGKCKNRLALEPDYLAYNHFEEFNQLYSILAILAIFFKFSQSSQPLKIYVKLCYHLPSLSTKHVFDPKKICYLIHVPKSKQSSKFSFERFGLFKLEKVEF